MQINITFLIQIINFWVCYTVFHRFFLKPTVKQIHKKAVLEQSIVQGLKDKEGILARLQQDKKDNLYAFRKYINGRYPLLVPAIKEVPTIDMLPQVKDETILFAKTMRDLFVEKASNAL